MSTKSKILEAALALFNAEGVGALSAVDVANAIGISTGHLYYHFKGKPELVLAQSRQYAEEVDLVLEAADDAVRGDGFSLETLWTYVQILLEEAWDARFFYREASALALRQPELAVIYRHIARRQREALLAMLSALTSRRILIAEPEILDGMARIMTTAVGFHVLQMELDGDTGPPRARTARAAAQIMLIPASLSPRP
jgi:AcrR family transcriptional regulator